MAYFLSWANVLKSNMRFTINLINEFYIFEHRLQILIVFFTLSNYSYHSVSEKFVFNQIHRISNARLLIDTWKKRDILLDYVQLLTCVGWWTVFQSRNLLDIYLLHKLQGERNYPNPGKIYNQIPPHWVGMLASRRH